MVASTLQAAELIGLHEFVHFAPAMLCRLRQFLVFRKQFELQSMTSYMAMQATDTINYKLNLACLSPKILFPSSIATKKQKLKILSFEKCYTVRVLNGDL